MFIVKGRFGLLLNNFWHFKAIFCSGWIKSIIHVMSRTKKIGPNIANVGQNKPLRMACSTFHYWDIWLDIMISWSISKNYLLFSRNSLNLPLKIMLIDFGRGLIDLLSIYELWHHICCCNYAIQFQFSTWQIQNCWKSALVYKWTQIFYLL